MHYLIKLIVLCTILRCVFIANAQPVNLTFEHFTADNGLPQNSVNCIMQDQQGFIWIGTQDGLCRYDGYSFKTYRNKAGSENTLSNNYVWHIIQDESGIIWIATFGGGINRFDPETETFTHFKWDKNNSNTISNNNVFYLLDGDTVVWAGTGDGFCSIHKSKNVIKRLLETPGNEDGLSGSYIGSLAFGEPGMLWLTSNDGLTRYNINSDKIEYFKDDQQIQWPNFENVWLFKKFDDSFYLVTNDGLYKMVMQTGQISVILKTRDIPTNTNLGILGVLPGLNNDYWVNTSNGIIYLSSDGRLTQFINEPGDPTSLANNNVLTISRSASGVLWFGTRGGLEKLEHPTKEIQLVKRQTNKSNTMSHSQVSGITEDKFGRIWMGTAKGVNVYNRQKDEFYIFRHQPGYQQSITQDYILSLLQDKNGIIWVGTKKGGLNKIQMPVNETNLKKAIVTNYSLNNINIQHICEDNDGILWLGTSGTSLIRFDTKTLATKTYDWKLDGSGPSHPYIFFVFIDSFDNIWLGTATGGLNLFDPVKEKFIYIRNNPENPHSLSGDLVLSIFEDSENNLWVGTTAGLNKLNLPLHKNMFQFFKDSVDVKQDKLFTIFTREEGLPNDLIYGMLDDNYGNFWISTNKGLVKFNTDSIKPVLKTYDVSNGLQSNEFNQNAFFKNNKGEMFFGGIGGLNIFHPDSLKGNTFVPPVYITDFKLFNESVPLQSDSTNKPFQLEKAIHRTNKIELEYHHAVITFDFVALNYINPEKNHYQYKLEGFNEDWVNAGTNRSATYTNLDAGTYLFKVRASNDDGIWNETGAHLTIKVPPPPWLSWYAFLLYFFILIILLYLFIEYRIRVATRKFEMEVKLEKVRTEARENFRIQTSQDFHDEAGNKITKINLFVELASSEKNGNYQKYLKKIAQNTRELSVGMRDFIWALDPEKDTLSDTLLRLKEFGESMFIDAGKDFEIIGLNSDYGVVVLNMDTRRALMLIFKEAMNNCAKYANALRVELLVKLIDNNLTLELRDDGDGFDQSSPDFKQGYGTKNMKIRAEKINGKLSIKSSTGKGTSVLFEMLIPHMGD